MLLFGETSPLKSYLGNYLASKVSEQDCVELKAKDYNPSTKVDSASLFNGKRL